MTGDHVRSGTERYICRARSQGSRCSPGAAGRAHGSADLDRTTRVFDQPGSSYIARRIARYRIAGRVVPGTGLYLCRAAPGAARRPRRCKDQIVIGRRPLFPRDSRVARRIKRNLRRPGLGNIRRNRGYRAPGAARRPRYRFDLIRPRLQLTPRSSFRVQQLRQVPVAGNPTKYS